jgi:hypothetical protein
MAGGLVATTIKTPYDSAKRLINSANLPTWMNDYDALRVSTYELYDDIYWAEPDTFKLQQRGSNDNSIYIPSGRIICNTMNRYAGKNFSAIMDPAFGTAAQQVAALQLVKDLFTREKFLTKYKTNKLYGTIRGDWFLYIQANSLKPQGSRLRVTWLHPSMVFPIHPANDVETTLGVDIVQRVVQGDDNVIKRTRYLKATHPDHPAYPSDDPLTPISYQADTLAEEDWEDPEKQEILSADVPVVLLPGITALPVYHFKNNEEPNNPFGVSEMRGIERLFAAVNQAISDEELALALDGLGMYKSDKGQPKDAAGNPTAWILGPGRVVHDDTFDRITGVSSVTPMLEHIQYIEDRMHEINGASDVARGKVDVSVAESGIALALRMAPILDAAADKDTLIQDTMDQFLFDLRAWFKTYEQTDMEAVRIVSKFGEKMPRDIQAEFDRLYQMVTADPPLISPGYFRDACRELGIAIPATENAAVIASEVGQYQAALAEAGGNDRLNQELDAAAADAPAAAGA